MARRRALIVEANRERCRFSEDTEYPGVLHLTLRQGPTVEDALRTFFEGETGV